MNHNAFLIILLFYCCFLRLNELLKGGVLVLEQNQHFGPSHFHNNGILTYYSIDFVLFIYLLQSIICICRVSIFFLDKSSIYLFFEFFLTVASCCYSGLECTRLILKSPFHAQPVKKPYNLPLYFAAFS